MIKQLGIWICGAVLLLSMGCNGKGSSQEPSTPVNPTAPVITQQPLNQIATVGQSATFTVTVTGTAPLTYQWHKGTSVLGANSATLTIPSVAVGDAGSYTVAVSNAAGSVTSSAATLTVNAATQAPQIIAQPADLTVTAGESATFTVGASGAPAPSFTWEKSTEGGGTWLPIGGATSATYRFTTALSDNATQFRAVATNSAGTAASNVALLTVTATAVGPSITTQPSSRGVTVGQTATFTVVAVGTSPLSYQWSRAGQAISGAIQSSYTTPATVSSDDGASFTVTVTNDVSSVISDPAILTVTAATSWQSRGIGAGGALYVPSINPLNSSDYYISCDMSGIYHTTDFGNSYELLNANQIQGGHYSAIRFTSDPNILYSFTYANGNNEVATKSLDGGITWNTLAGDPIPTDTKYSLWVDGARTDRVILSGYSEIYSSTNGGTSFQLVHSAANAGNGVVVGGAFFDGSNVYLGTSDGLLVSGNGGQSFINAGTPGIPAGEYISSFVVAKAGATTRFFALTGANVYPMDAPGGDYWGFVRGIYSMDNVSGSWTARMTGIDINNDFVQYLAMARNDVNTVYAAGSYGGVPEVMKTTDAGLHWANTFLSTNNQNILTGWSGDGGDRGWGYGEVVYGIEVAPSDSSKVVITDMGFAHVSADGGTTWKQAYVSNADQHATGSTNIAKDTYHGIGLENTSCWQVLWNDAQNLFAAYSDIQGIRSTDAGVTWSFNYTGLSANTTYRLVRDSASGILYAGTSNIHDIYQSTRLADAQLDAADSLGEILYSSDMGATWNLLHHFGHPVFWIAQDPNQAHRMYASVIHSTQGGVYITNNLQLGGSSTWTLVPNLTRAVGHPACLVVLNDGKLLATFSGRRDTSGFTAVSGLFIYDPGTSSWSDVSDPGMHYWTKDVVLDPTDASQNTWYVCVFSGWGGAPNGLGGIYKTTDRGAHWTRINDLDRVTSLTFNPQNTDEVFVTTEWQGLWHSSDIHAATPVFTQVADYPFKQPERVFFNPFAPTEMWVTSFGNGMKMK